MLLAADAATGRDPTRTPAVCSPSSTAPPVC